jgi:hypothetical protein
MFEIFLWCHFTPVESVQQFPVDRRLVESQKQCGYGYEEKVTACIENWTPAAQPIAWSIHLLSYQIFKLISWATSIIKCLPRWSVGEKSSSSYIRFDAFLASEYNEVFLGYQLGKVVQFCSTTPWRRIGEWRCSYTHSLILALDGGEWSASCPGRFTPREIAPGTHWIGGWVGSRAVLDTAVKKKFPAPAGNQTLEPRSSSP